MADKERDTLLFMATELLEMVENDIITDSYDVDFIRNAYKILRCGFVLSEKRKAYLKECYNNKYEHVCKICGTKLVIAPPHSWKLVWCPKCKKEV